MRVSGIPFVQGRNDYKDADGTKFAIAIHNTSNNASDEGEASYAKRRTDGVSSHFYVDRDSVTQSLDTKVRAGHAGSREGNEHAIAVEITGANGKSRQWWLDNVCWDLLGRVLAEVCRAYNIPVRRRTVAEMRANPKVRGFYGHDDMRRAWGGTSHTDPGPNFPWDHLLSVVKSKMEDDDMPSAHEIAKAVWGTDDLVPAPWPVRTKDNPNWAPGTTLHHGLGHAIAANTKLNGVNAKIDGLLARIEGLVAVINAMAEAVKAGGGSIDTGVVLSRLDGLAKQVTDLSAKLAAAEGERDEMRRKLADALAGQPAA